MTHLRNAFAALVVVLLVLGWGGAAMAGVHGTAGEWASSVDDGKTGAVIQRLALIILVAAVGLAFVPDREEAAE